MPSGLGCAGAFAALRRDGKVSSSTVRTGVLCLEVMRRVREPRDAGSVDSESLPAVLPASLAYGLELLRFSPKLWSPRCSHSDLDADFREDSRLVPSAERFLLSSLLSWSVSRPLTLRSFTSA